MFCEACLLGDLFGGQSFAFQVPLDRSPSCMTTIGSPSSTGRVLGKR